MYLSLSLSQEPLEVITVIVQEFTLRRIVLWATIRNLTSNSFLNQIVYKYK